jgi:hypothetical protein
MAEITPAPQVRPNPEMLKRAAAACRNIQGRATGGTDWFGWVPEYLDRLAALAALDGEKVSSELIRELRHAADYENDPGLDAMRGVLLSAAVRIEELDAQMAGEGAYDDDAYDQLSAMYDELRAERDSWRAIADQLADALRRSSPVGTSADSSIFADYTAALAAYRAAVHGSRRNRGGFR